MSRTDKDRPWRLKREELSTFPWDRPGRFSWRRYVHQFGHPPRWYRHAEWFGPDRARARDEARDAVKEYRAHGNVEKVLRTEQHRYRAIWDWN